MNSGMCIGGPMDGKPLDFPGDVYSVLPEPEPSVLRYQETPTIETATVEVLFQYWFFKCHTHDDKNGYCVFGYWVPLEKRHTSHHYLFTRLNEAYYSYADLKR